MDDLIVHIDKNKTGIKDPGRNPFRKMRSLNVILFSVLALIIFMSTASINCSATSLYSDNGLFKGSLFADVKARSVGDIVTILVYEDARATNKSSKTSGKSLQGDVADGTGALSFIPSAGLELGAKSNGTESVAQSGSLTATVSARIIEDLGIGFLKIEGKRGVTINGERQELVVTGVIRSRDIGQNNSISSSLVADAEIQFTGRPELTKSGGILSNLWNGLVGIFNWIF